MLLISGIFPIRDEENNSGLFILSIDATNFTFPPPRGSRTGWKRHKAVLQADLISVQLCTVLEALCMPSCPPAWNASQVVRWIKCEVWSQKEIHSVQRGSRHPRQGTINGVLSPGKTKVLSQLAHRSPGAVMFCNDASTRSADSLRTATRIRLSLWRWSLLVDAYTSGAGCCISGRSGAGRGGAGRGEAGRAGGAGQGGARISRSPAGGRPVFWGPAQKAGMLPIPQRGNAADPRNWSIRG